MASARYRGVRVVGTCEHCGQPLPLLGPVRQVPCPHCQQINERSEEFWAALVEAVDQTPNNRKLRDHDHDLDVEVVQAVPAELEATAFDAPAWLRSRVRAVRRFSGAQQEGDGGGGRAPAQGQRWYIEYADETQAALGRRVRREQDEEELKEEHALRPLEQRRELEEGEWKEEQARQQREEPPPRPAQPEPADRSGSALTLWLGVFLVVFGSAAVYFLLFR